jgi:hypothetical protein
MSTLRLLKVQCWLVCLGACGSEPDPAVPCPEPTGEFPFTHCAYVEGRLTAGGTPVIGRGIRVDDYVPPLGYAYVSDAAATDAAGRFDLVVYRINQLQPPTSEPDTARVFVKLFANPEAAKPGAVPDDSLSVLMTFAPMGVPVDTTRAELSLP